MQIIVKHVNRMSNVFDVDIKAPVSSFSDDIHKAFNISADKQRFVFSGNPVNVNNTFEQCGITTPLVTVYLVDKMEGGSEF